MPATLAGLVAGLLALFIALPCALAADPATLVFAPFDGKKGHSMRREAYRAAEDEGQKIVDVDEVETRISNLGLDMGKADDRVTLAREFDAHAVIVGRVDDGRKWDVYVTVYNGADGTELGDYKFRDKKGKIKKAVRSLFWRKLSDAIGKGEQPAAATEAAVANANAGNTNTTATTPPVTAPPPTQPPPTATAMAEDGDDADAGVGTTLSPGRPAVPGAEGTSQPLEIAVGIRGFNRAFEYNDDLNRSLRPYTLDFGPSLNVDLAWFPGGHATSGIGQWFGLVGNFHMAFGIDSSTPDGTDAFPTSSLGWNAGLRFRVPLGLSEIALDLGYGQESFTIDDAAEVDRPLIPNVDYSNVRMGLSGRAGLHPQHALQASAGYLLVLDAGEIQSEDFFPHADVNGLYATFGYSFAIIPELELRALVDWSHYWFTMNPEPDDTIFTEHDSVAGGARDDYIGATFNIVYRMYAAP